MDIKGVDFERVLAHEIGKSTKIMHEFKTKSRLIIDF